MSCLLKLILSLSLSGTLLILPLLLLRPVYGNRLSKQWQYYIWLVVIVRLLLPITPETSLVGSLFQQAGQAAYSGASVSQAEEQNLSNSDIIADFNGDSAPEPDASEIKENLTDHTEENREPDSMNNTTQYSAPADSDSLNSGNILTERTAQALLTVWLAVSLLLLVRKITVYQSFVKYVNAGSRPIDDIALLERFGQMMEQNHIKGSIDLCSNSLISSPLLIGFAHPRIILPDENLSETDFYYTILHELIHYKRRDMFYKWLVQFTICLHWFNPIVYLMERKINCLCELSCDERVMESLSAEDRKRYGDTLLNAAGTGGSYKDALASLTLNESKELLKGRLESIMNYHKITKTIKAAALFFTAILIGAAAVLGAYAAPADRISSGSDGRISPDSSSRMVSDSGSRQALDYTIQYENGTYYILAYGADETDKPTSSVSNGFYKLTLVRKDGYTSFGAWDTYDMQSLVRHITEQCRTGLANGRLTQEDMDIVIAAATKIQEAYLSGGDTIPDRRSFSYRQTASYQRPYIIEYGYNLPSPDRDFYDSMTITLADGLDIQIYFSEESRKFMSDEKAVSAITSLISQKLLPSSSSSQPLKALLIVSMEDVGDADINSLAEKYYREEMLSYFFAVFTELDIEVKQKYLELAYDDDKISFFASCIGDTVMPENIVDDYILKAYEDGKTDFFAVLSGMLDEDSRKQWLEKCENDGRIDYWYILSEDPDTDPTLNLPDTASAGYPQFADPDTDLQEYLEETGVPRIRLLLDERTDGSFENFSYNETGTADIRLLRDQDNEIVRIEYLSTEEAAEIIEDIVDYDDPLSDDLDKDYPTSSAADILDLNRITKQDLPVHLQNKLDTCDSGKWYVIDTGGRQYIYYNGLPHTYAYSYEPRITGSEAGDLITVAVSDIAAGTPLLRDMDSAVDYVLLAFSYSPGIPGTDCDLSITYNKAPVKYELISE